MSNIPRYACLITQQQILKILFCPSVKFLMFQEVQIIVVIEYKDVSSQLERIQKGKYCKIWFSLYVAFVFYLYNFIYIFYLCVLFDFRTSMYCA